MIHGQCLTVGVGGYLLGGGVNALGASARFGFGAQNVIKMKVTMIISMMITMMIMIMKGVLADGSMATITKEKVVVRKNGVTRTIFMTEDTDLWFGLRGAGQTSLDYTTNLENMDMTFFYLCFKGFIFCHYESIAKILEVD